LDSSVCYEQGRRAMAAPPGEGRTGGPYRAELCSNGSRFIAGQHGKHMKAAPASLATVGLFPIYQQGDAAT
jgi:hypothetical protein